MKTDYVVDSYALLALLNDEPGAARMEDLLKAAKREEARLIMSLINLGELAYIIDRHWGDKRLSVVLAYLEETSLEMIPASKERIFAAARIKARYPISYADAFAAGLAQEAGATLLTGDPEFQALAKQIDIEWLET